MLSAPQVVVLSILKVLRRKNIHFEPYISAIIYFTVAKSIFFAVDATFQNPGSLLYRTELERWAFNRNKQD
jgi:hypothetical protein